MSSCAPPPEPRTCFRDHVDPKADTVQDAEGHTMMVFDLEGGVSYRHAEQADMRHCASCTCPVEGAHP